MNNEATIPGTYSLINMPDGKQELVEQIVNEKGEKEWVFVKDRVKKQKDDEEFNNRFKDTKTVPQDLDEIKTDPLIRKDPNHQINPYIKQDKDISDITSSLNVTQKHLYAHLIEILGSTPHIILRDGLSQKVIDDLRKNKAMISTIIVMIKTLNHPEWNKVLLIMTNLKNSL